MSSLKEPFILNESQCDNLETHSSDILTRKHNTRSANTVSESSSVEQTTIEVIPDDSNSEAESFSSTNNNSQSFRNRNSSSSYIETVQFSNKLESTIHRRYIDYFNRSQDEKDNSKTDYTYAHSFAYSAFVPLKRQFSWLVPNMSRQSLSSATRHSGQERQTAVDGAATTSSKTSSYSRKQTHRSASSSSSNIMAGSQSSIPPNGKTIFKRTQAEYSDDDEDQNYAVSQPKLNGIRPRKPYISSSAHINEDDDDEELTIIRRINRVIHRTFRNYSFSNKNSQETSHSVARSSSSRTDSLKEFNFIRALLVPLSIFFLFIACCFGGYYTLPEGSLNSVKTNVDKAYQATSSLLSLPFGPKTLIEYRNADQFIAEIERLRLEVQDLRLKSEEKDKNADSEKTVPTINMPDFDSILLRLDEIERKVGSCCSLKPQEIDTIAMEANITSRLEGLMKRSFNSSFSTLQNSIEERLVTEMKILQTKIDEFVRQRMNEVKNEVSDMAKPATNVSPEIAFVQELIRKAILKYDSDKTGEADFALESAGAWILSTRCSETYQLNSASYKIFGLTMWKSSSSPRVVIQPGVIPGECWCFRGNEGRLGIHLSANIIPSAVTYEHIPKTLSRDGHIHSAPQSFSVYGLKTETDLEPELLGEYIFDIDSDESMQRFKVQNRQIAAHGFNKVELVIKSNHGHPEYTCLYRFRVHGQLHIDTTMEP